MTVCKAQKYLFAGLVPLMFSLLLTLSGCDTTSDPPQFYTTTGSWQGTIGTDYVRGVIAPDQTCHLTIIDKAGAIIPGAGEYVGGGITVDTTLNLGSMTLELIKPNATGSQTQVTFKLSADRIFSSGAPSIDLRRTSDAVGPAEQSAVVGRWSFSAVDNFTDVVIASDGTLGGGDGVQCKYSGTMTLQDPAWNIYNLDLTISDYTYDSCPLFEAFRYKEISYHGLAMPWREESTGRHLWLSTNTLAFGSSRTFLGNLAETKNIAPGVEMVALGEHPNHSVLVVEGSGAEVELDAQGSADANHDSLTYEWSGTAPDGTPLNNIQGSGSVVTFVPGSMGSYSLSLRVSDGVAFTTLTKDITIASTPLRFVDRGDGTVLDTKTNLLWLKDAGCVPLNQNNDIWGVNAALAKERVDALAVNVCGLADSSVPGDWRLPTPNEFSRIFTPSKFLSPPALPNAKGDGQWREGDAFVGVGATFPGSGVFKYWYWAINPVNATDWYFVDFDYRDQINWLQTISSTAINAVWPVRARRLDEY